MPHVVIVLQSWFTENEDFSYNFGGLISAGTVPAVSLAENLASDCWASLGHFLHGRADQEVLS